MTNSSVSPTTPPSSNPNQSLNLLLKQLRLSHMLNHWQMLEAKATQEGWSYSQFLQALCQMEAERKWSVRVQRALKEAQLPCGKSFTSFSFEHCPSLKAAPLIQLSQNTRWLERAENLILLGPSGVGKMHLGAAVARSAIELGKRANTNSL